MRQNSLQDQHLEGFVFSDYDDQQGMAVFTSSTGQVITYLEREGTMPPAQIPEGAIYRLEYLKDGDFPVVEEQAEGVNQITATWEKAGYPY